jgi:hypothetical protein
VRNANAATHAKPNSFTNTDANATTHAHPDPYAFADAGAAFEYFDPLAG